MQDGKQQEHKDMGAWGMVSSLVENSGTQDSLPRLATTLSPITLERRNDARNSRQNNDTTLMGSQVQKPAEARQSQGLEDRKTSPEAMSNNFQATPNATMPSDSDRQHRIRVKNRRKAYLDAHPSYFSNPDLELADPLLYDRCIRHFQTTKEREEEGKKKGYAGVMEADLWRSEAKLAALARKQLGDDVAEGEKDAEAGEMGEMGVDARQENGELGDEDESETPESKEEGDTRWREAMERRFLDGRDEDFGYENVDGDEGLDVLERREREQEWFEDESPGWMDGREGEGEGETGVQDF